MKKAHSIRAAFEQRISGNYARFRVWKHSKDEIEDDKKKIARCQELAEREATERNLHRPLKGHGGQRISLDFT